MSHLRLVKPPTTPEATEPTAFVHTNRMGVVYYLHEGTTKTGKPRYFFAKTIRDGALSSIPEGFEVSESVNAVVTLRRKKKGAVPPADLELAQATIRRHRHLRDHVARADGDTITIYEPQTRREELESLERGFRSARYAAYIEERMRKARFTPVMKFKRNGDEYGVFRMTYRGDGDWSYMLDSGPLEQLLNSHLRHVGKEEFFGLM